MTDRPFRTPPAWPCTRRGALALLAGAAGALLSGLPHPRGLLAAPQAANNPLLLDTPKTPVAALDFMGITAEGKPIRLSDQRGNVVLLNFGATWCVPCLEEMPSMDRLARQMKGKKVKVLAIDLQETAERVQQFAKSNKFSYDLVLDPAGEISHHYGVLRIPVSYILDQKGFIIRRAVGPRVWDSKEAIALFEGLLNAAATKSPEPEAATLLNVPAWRRKMLGQ